MGINFLDVILYFTVTGCSPCVVEYGKADTKNTRPTFSHQDIGSGGSSVVRAPDLRSKGLGFESLHELPENFLLQGQLFVLTPAYFGIRSTPVLPQ